MKGSLGSSGASPSSYAQICKRKPMRRQGMGLSCFDWELGYEILGVQVLSLHEDRGWGRSWDTLLALSNLKKIRNRLSLHFIATPCQEGGPWPFNKTVQLPGKLFSLSQDFHFGEHCNRIRERSVLLLYEKLRILDRNWALLFCATAVLKYIQGQYTWAMFQECSVKYAQLETVWSAFGLSETGTPSSSLTYACWYECMLRARQSDDLTRVSINKLHTGKTSDYNGALLPCNCWSLRYLGMNVIYIKKNFIDRLRNPFAQRNVCHVVELFELGEVLQITRGRPQRRAKSAQAHADASLREPTHVTTENKVRITDSTWSNNEYKMVFFSLFCALTVVWTTYRLQPLISQIWNGSVHAGSLQMEFCMHSKSLQGLCLTKQISDASFVLGLYSCLVSKRMWRVESTTTGQLAIGQAVHIHELSICGHLFCRKWNLWILVVHAYAMTVFTCMAEMHLAVQNYEIPPRTVHVIAMQLDTFAASTYRECGERRAGTKAWTWTSSADSQPKQASGCSTKWYALKIKEIRRLLCIYVFIQVM